MKSLALSLPIAAALCGSAFAGEIAPPPPPVDMPVAGFESARRPITNPTLFDLAIPQSYVHPLFLYQSLPSSISTEIGSVPLDGDLQVYAIQLQWAVTERLAITATKDGYIDFNPDNTLAEEDGWANLAAGLKYAFVYDPASQLAVSGQLLIEVPTGNSDVWQGEGDGVAIPSVSALKIAGPVQLAGTLGAKIPFDSDAESTMLFSSIHLSYEVTPRFFPLVELNYFRVLDEGDGGSRFGSQAGGLVPAIAQFEAGDLVNFGAANADKNPDFLSLGVGFRFRATDNVDLGFAFELPLTDDEDSIMENRFTLDLVYRF
ncbi:MAG: hypothetical protein R3F11_15800 [Verrucomicrobiales bacterium]